MKIALCQINSVIGDIEGNKDKILHGYEQGIRDNCDLVICPELSLCGYPPLDFVEKEEFRRKVEATAQYIASQTGDTALLFGSITEEEENVGTGVYNSAILCYNGKIQAVQDKSLIPNYDVFDEVRYFEPAKLCQVHEFKGEKLGLSICEDIWNDMDFWKKRRYPTDPVNTLVKMGATILLNISASPYAYGKREQRRKMLSTVSKGDSIPLAYVCCAGAQTDLIFDGASMCFNKKGELVRLGKAFREDYFIFDTKEDYTPVAQAEGSYEEEVLNALIFGVREYCMKTGFKKILVGLSGGIDSALVAYIAVRAMGKENVHVVMMPSEYSSLGSLKDSEKLIDILGISSDVLSIQPVFEKVKEVLEPHFKGLPEDVTEENIQPRIRGMYLMAMSNKFGSLLLTTGNKSEVAVGYATLYGDMCGALGVIADVYKTDVYRMANYINREGEVIPYEIINKAPSAELRHNQTDQDSLPPYDLLDKILKMYLEENKELNQIVKEIGHPDTVKRVLNLVDFNEFKRKQAAPALRVSTKAFGYGRRFPIVQKWRR
ncbi:MAG: NAD+ synthase [Bacteroidota bacterium]|nr:NAD+ synthase [Ignavibacteria bacterium]MCU7498314.1 NAD+ synthase [Ignavibacteria bacterium]MCU7512667.1 NAD+ synthase [Ignavibacteria bacterium]MCU7520208.1 NAD+ synthase [Ignavibacteria bacterium]MCU7523671.1 NAD+ synthase [Ignavibacteria bacterium]